MFYLMLLVSIVTWTIHFIESAVLWIVGWPVCALLAEASHVEDRYVERFGRNLLEWKPRWAFVWGNDEDGIDGLRGGSVDQMAWAEQTKTASDWWRIVKWSCWRNPAGNLRFLRPFGFLIDPARVEYVGNSIDPDASYDESPGTYWYFAWHGIYSGAWIIYRGFQFRIGWKILPRDKGGLAPDDYRNKGCGFALQFQRK